MSTKNLYDTEAKKKLKKLVDSGDVAMMATNLGSTPLSAVPMHTKKIDDDGNIWFLSTNTSDHNADLLKSSEIQLLYNDKNDMEFVSVYGEGEIISDQNTLSSLYDDKDNAWFEGPEDPNLTAIKVKPKEGAYWSNKDNKLVTFFKLQMAAVTGDDKDIGESGKLKM